MVLWLHGGQSVLTASGEEPSSSHLRPYVPQFLAGTEGLGNWHSYGEFPQTISCKLLLPVLSHVQLFVTPWTMPCKLLCFPRDSPGKNTGGLPPSLLQGIFGPRMEPSSPLPPALAGRWLTTAQAHELGALVERRLPSLALPMGHRRARGARETQAGTSLVVSG